MKILVTGANGQLGWELKRVFAENNDIQAVLYSRAELDICSTEQVNQVVAETCPDVVINAAAYTAVDKAEGEPELANDVNAVGVKNLALSCQERNIYFLHISTDFVFNGEEGRPYSVDHPLKPLGVYGETKAKGELAIQNTLQGNFAIIRTAWVYSCHGNNFVKTMLRLMAEKEKLGVVGDQIGSPTWAKGLAQVCLAFVRNKVNGIYHWTDAGVASWYDFAVAIQELAIEKGMLDKKIPINPILTEDYPTPAKRPSYSVLDKALTYSVLKDRDIVHWRTQLSAMLEELKLANQ
ncbi:dTDP-4-dehydrorhamnose reductase [Thalassocella blandensis]|nr:dTDP-4-dehydrorhamnose reductase [Thalassocella blandensis]